MLFPEEEMCTVMNVFIPRGREVRGALQWVICSFLVEERAETVDLMGGECVQMGNSHPETQGDPLPYESVCRMSYVGWRWTAWLLGFVFTPSFGEQTFTNSLQKTGLKMTRECWGYSKSPGGIGRFADGTDSMRENVPALSSGQRKSIC